jgi:hypothetical protein
MAKTKEFQVVSRDLTTSGIVEIDGADWAEVSKYDWHLHRVVTSSGEVSTKYIVQAAVLFPGETSRRTASLGSFLMGDYTRRTRRIDATGYNFKRDNLILTDVLTKVGRDGLGEEVSAPVDQEPSPKVPQVIKESASARSQRIAQGIIEKHIAVGVSPTLDPMQEALKSLKQAAHAAVDKATAITIKPGGILIIETA